VKIVLVQQAGGAKGSSWIPPPVSITSKKEDECLAQQAGGVAPKVRPGYPSPVSITSKKEDEGRLCWCNKLVGVWRQRFVLDTLTGEHYKQERR
jgi:hypothetical protein